MENEKQIASTRGRRIVFISCGQHTEEEKKLGKQACDLVKECTPFDGYFAQNQTSLKSLAENVLSRLYESVGFIAIMHYRGKIETRGTIRASVWVEQEVAMATMMEQVLKRPLHVVLFTEQGIAIEGVRQQIQFNPIEFTKNDEVIGHLREILPTWKEPLYEGVSEQQLSGIRRKLSVTRLNAWHPTLTVWLTNRSDQSIGVKSVSFWHNQRQLNIGTPSDNRDVAGVPSGTNDVGIACVTHDDAMLKLKSWGAIDVGLPNYSFLDNIDLEVRVEYTVAGMEDQFCQLVPVRVHGNRQIESR
jgi:hypothetical protein